MKYSIASVLALAASPAVAFPEMMTSQGRPSLEASLKKRATGPQGTGALPATPPAFNATAQYVSTSGQYAFVAPGPGDARGQCPGLNAMANHGYLPHNGVATAQQFVTATETVFGMGSDLANFLAYYGAFVDGDGTSWSIGGTKMTGIGGSHGNYETDSSPLKSDLNQYGSLGTLIMEQFYELYNMQPNATTANYNLEVMRSFRGTRFQESIAKNPYFTYAPFAGVEVSQAAYTFIYRFMSNKSAEYPEGVLNKDVLKSFMSITGPENNLTWTFGHEQIPNNWYKRNSADAYTIPYFQADILYFAETQPEILAVGCNEGTVNSYNTFSASSLTNGTYTAQSVAANPICFATAYALYEGIKNEGLSTSKVTSLVKAFGAVSQSLGGKCQNLTFFDTAAMQSACPGFSFYGGPTGPVAPGAVQS